MKNILYPIIFFTMLFSTYNIGDTISQEHLDMAFSTCYGDISEITFDDYKNSSVIWLNFAATWWTSCYNYLQYGDQVYLDWENDARVQTFIVLDDIGPAGCCPYSCQQWASAGISSS